MPYDYDTRAETVATHVWETWTSNGSGLDADDCAQTYKSCVDAVANSYRPRMTDSAWRLAALRRLGWEG